MLEIGSLVDGKYKILNKVGQGGMSVVYLAMNEKANKQWAVKEIRKKGNGKNDEIVVNSLLAEANMMKKLDHPSLPRIVDIIDNGITIYVVMDYIEGGSLKDYVEANGYLSEKKTSGYILQVADALNYLHSFNILHLDIKPSNILIDSNERLVLIDFGISKRYDLEGNQTSTTPVGISKGYAPIEQYQQGNISGFTPSTDIYSLGATMYFLLTGETPPEASAIYEDGLPNKVNSFGPLTYKTLKGSMAPRRKDRFQSVKDFASSLTQNDSYIGDPPSNIEETTVILERNNNENKVQGNDSYTEWSTRIGIVFVLIVTFTLVVISLTK